MISVAIPVYNRTSVFRETLESILAQSLAPAEIVVVDDGSTEDLKTAIEPFLCKIKLITIENSGTEAARAWAIENCRQDWIALCDSDDLWSPDHLSRFVEIIKTWPKVDMIFSNFCEFGPRKRIDNKFQSMSDRYWNVVRDTTDPGYVFLGDSVFPSILFENPIFPSATMFRRSLYEKVGGIRKSFTGMRAADADLTRRFALRGCLACDTKTTTLIRKFESNISSSNIYNLFGRLRVLADNVHDEFFHDQTDLIKKAVKMTADELIAGSFSERQFSYVRAASRIAGFRNLAFNSQLRVCLSALPDAVLSRILPAA